MFLRALAEIRPPLLKPVALKALKKEIDPQAERRGRRGVSFRSNEDLVEALRVIRRPDVPQMFLDCLILRLESGTRFIQRQSNAASQKAYKRQFNGMITDGLKRELEDLIEPGADSVTHPILGTFSIKNPEKSRGHKALTLTAEILRKLKLGGHVTNGRLKNIISEYENGK